MYLTVKRLPWFAHVIIWGRSIIICGRGAGFIGVVKLYAREESKSL